MNEANWLRNILWALLIIVFVGLVVVSYKIYTSQINKIDFLKEDLGKTYQVLEKTKSQLSETKQETTILTTENKSLAEEVTSQEEHIAKIQQEKENLKGHTEEISSQKEELEATLTETKELFKEQIKLHKLIEEQMEKDFQKRLTIEKTMFVVQEKELNDRIQIAETRLNDLIERNDSLVRDLRKNNEILAELNQDSQYETEIYGKFEKAERELKLKGKIFQLNKMLKENKKLIAQNEKIIVDVAEERQEIGNRLEQTEEELKKERLKFHYNLGLTYDENREYKEALIEYKKALKVDPTDADVHYNIAIIYDEYIPDMKKAVTHYQVYLELSPGAEDAGKVALWLKKAKRELEYGKDI